MTEANNAPLSQENTPNENSTPLENMASLLEKEGIEIEFPKQGEIRKGVIASITSSEILVSVGTKSEGLISGKEFENIPREDLEKLHEGQEIPVYVVTPEDQNGNLILSLSRGLEEESWAKANQLLESKVTNKSTIVGYNKGGLIVQMDTLRGFIPASQVSLSRRANVTGDTPEERWSDMVGEEIEYRVIEVDPERRRLILSERAASSETRESIKERVIDALNTGDVRTGKVTSLADFGAFVNISGADGLVHLSEISWDRINHPKDVLSVGQEVKVKVISIDDEKKRIGLSIRQLQDDPWKKRIEKFQVGQLIEGTITRLTKFGAFARLEEDLEGLIHISEISEKHIEHPKEVLKEGDVLTLRVIKISPEKHRIGLSLKRVDSMAYADMDWQHLLEDEDFEEEETEEEVEQEITTSTSEGPEVAASKDEESETAQPEEEEPEIKAD